MQSNADARKDARKLEAALGQLTSLNNQHTFTLTQRAHTRTFQPTSLTTEGEVHNHPNRIMFFIKNSILRFFVLHVISHRCSNVFPLFTCFLIAHFHYRKYFVVLTKACSKKTSYHPKYPSATFCICPKLFINYKSLKLWSKSDQKGFKN